MNGKIKNIVFDLGGVLLEWNINKILETSFESPETRKSVKKETFLHPDWFKLDKGILAEEVAVNSFSQRTGTSVKQIENFMNIVKNSLIPIPESITLLEQLFQKGVPLYCLSNMHEKSWERIRKRFDFWDKFRGIVISWKLKTAKPEKEIFQYLLSEFKLNPKETVFIDDHEKNIEAARGMRIHGILFESPERCRKILLPLLS